MHLVKIKHPEWVHGSQAGKTVDLYCEGKIPEAIAGWMMVVSLKRPLRAIYGSDLRAALALLWQATGRRTLDNVAYWIWSNVTHRAEAEELKRDAMRSDENAPCDACVAGNCTTPHNWRTRRGESGKP